MQGRRAHHSSPKKSDIIDYGKINHLIKMSNEMADEEKRVAEDKLFAFTDMLQASNQLGFAARQIEKGNKEEALDDLKSASMHMDDARAAIRQNFPLRSHEVEEAYLKDFVPIFDHLRDIATDGRGFPVR